MKTVEMLSRIEVERVQLETEYIKACVALAATGSNSGDPMLAGSDKRSVQDQAFDSACDAMRRVNKILGGGALQDMANAQQCIDNAMKREKDEDTPAE